jgi:hypothetical protein
MVQTVKNWFSRLGVIVVILNRLTGKTARHNRALRDVRDWTAGVQKFLNDYRLYGSPDMDTLLQNSSQANFDLIAMAYKGHNLTSEAASITRARITPLLVGVIDGVESMRRALLNPTSRRTRLPEVVSGLCVSFEKLQEKLSEIDYL